MCDSFIASKAILKTQVFLLVLHNKYLVNAVDTDGLFQKQHGISSHNAEHSSMHFQLFMA